MTGGSRPRLEESVKYWIHRENGKKQRRGRIRSLGLDIS